MTVSFEFRKAKTKYENGQIKQATDQATKKQEEKEALQIELAELQVKQEKQQQMLQAMTVDTEQGKQILS